jgi:alpha-amylase
MDQLEEETNKAQPKEAEQPPQQRWVRSTASYSNLSWFKDALEWFDEDVEAGELYTYQVVAVQMGPDRASELKTMRRCSSRLLDEVQDNVRGPESEQAEVKAVAFVDIPRLGEKRTRILFQAFDWNSHYTPNWYLHVQEMLPELRSVGVDMIWLPPPSDSVDHHGYLPRKWYQLDCNYGTASMLQDLVMAMNEQEIAPMLDLVVNHRCASQQDTQGRWLVFTEPDWGGWAICRNSPAVPGGSGNDGTGEEMAQFAPSVDHTSQKVQADVKEFINHMMHEIGFRALRFDMVKGYGPRFQAEYVRAAGHPFAVAENWNGCVNGLSNYVNQCQGVMAAFDFPFYYALKGCVHSNNFCGMRGMDGRLTGLVGRDPVHSCTFIENHDTAQLPAAGGCFGNNEQVLRGYAIILTHPGVPTVFMGDYNRGSHVREKILALCAVRQEGELHVTSSLEIREARGGLYAAICGGKVALKVGTDNWSPGDGWTFVVSGHEFCVWVRR